MKRKIKKPHWNIELPFVNDYIRSLSPSFMMNINEGFQGQGQQYSILNHAKRSIEEIAEIAAVSTDKDVKKFIALKLSRLVYYEIITTVETELQIKDENDLYVKVNAVYNELYKDEALAKLIEKKEDEINREIESISYQTILTSEDTLSINKKIKFDQNYNYLAGKYIEEDISPIIKNCIEGFFKNDLSFKKLSSHSLDERQLYMLIGAPANGKGTLFKMVEREAREKNGMDFADVVKINTDYHRDLVINEQGRATKKHHDARFSHDESNLITLKIYSKLEKKMNDGNSPNILIECAHYSSRKFNLALMGDGCLDLNFIAIPNPEIALRRALTRGEEDGRYVDTGYMLKSQKDISNRKKFAKIMMSNNNIYYKLYDNLLDEADPQLIMEADVRSKKIIIHDIRKVDNFFHYEKIKLDAEDTEGLITSSSCASLSSLSDDGIRLSSTSLLWRDLLEKSPWKELKEASIKFQLNEIINENLRPSPTSITFDIDEIPLDEDIVKSKKSKSSHKLKYQDSSKNLGREATLTPSLLVKSNEWFTSIDFQEERKTVNIVTPSSLRVDGGIISKNLRPSPTSITFDIDEIPLDEDIVKSKKSKYLHNLEYQDSSENLWREMTLTPSLLVKSNEWFTSIDFQEERRELNIVTPSSSGGVARNEGEGIEVQRNLISDFKDKQQESYSNNMEIDLPGTGGSGFIDDEYLVIHQGISSLIIKMLFRGITIPPTRISIAFHDYKKSLNYLFDTRGESKVPESCSSSINNYIAGTLIAQALNPGIICVTDMINGKNYDSTCYSYYKNSYNSYGYLAVRTLVVKTLLSGAAFEIANYYGFSFVNSVIFSKLGFDTYPGGQIDIPTSILINLTPSLIDLGSSIIYQGVLMVDSVLNPNGDRIDLDHYI